MFRFVSRTIRISLATAPLVAVGACDIRGITGPDAPPDVRPFVTGAAAAAVTSGGFFSLPAPVAPGERPIIGPQRAGLLGASYVLTFAPWLRGHWNEQRGRQIDVERLRHDERVFYASTPYASFPEGYHPTFTTMFGPYYVMRMISGSTPVLLVSVAAYATEVEIDESGKIYRPGPGGSEFVSQGFPLDTMKPHLAAFATPEEAVVTVARLTGAKVSEVPELMRVGMPLGPFSSVWKITLDRNVRVRTTDGSRTVEAQHLYLGSERGRRLMTPAAEQPTEYEMYAFRIGPDGEDLPPEFIRLPILPGRPTVFEEVVVERASN